MGVEIQNLDTWPIDPANSLQTMQQLREAVMKLQRQVADNFLPNQRNVQPPWVSLQLIRISGYSNLGSGWFKGRLQRRDGTQQLDPSQDLDLSTLYGDINSSDDCYCYDVGYSGLAAHAHVLLVDNSYVWGRFIDYSIGKAANSSTNTAAISSLPVFEIVSVPVGAGFLVNLTQTGGSNGNKTTAASWTYTAKTIDNQTSLGTVLSPQKPRPNGTATAATLGVGYYDANGDFQLAEAYEKYGTGSC